MTKVSFDFGVIHSWSDYGNDVSGRLPSFIIYAGEKTAIDTDTICIEAYDRDMPFTHNVPMGHGIIANLNFWGDDGTRRSGRSGTNLEIRAPGESSFLYRLQCQYCCDDMGHSESGETEDEHGCFEEWCAIHDCANPVQCECAYTS